MAIAIDAVAAQAAIDAQHVAMLHALASLAEFSRASTWAAFIYIVSLSTSKTLIVQSFSLVMSMRLVSLQTSHVALSSLAGRKAGYIC